jgi:hypothetical protein
MAKQKQPAEQPENQGGAAGGESLEGGVAPTGDKPSAEAQEVVDSVTVFYPDVNTVASDYNPTTPDGSPPANNLPGPHGPQGHGHLQQDPSES